MIFLELAARKEIGLAAANPYMTQLTYSNPTYADKSRFMRKKILIYADKIKYMLKISFYAEKFCFMINLPFYGYGTTYSPPNFFKLSKPLFLKNQTIYYPLSSKV